MTRYVYSHGVLQLISTRYRSALNHCHWNGGRIVVGRWQVTDGSHPYQIVRSEGGIIIGVIERWEQPFVQWNDQFAY